MNFRERTVCTQLSEQGNLYGKQARILLLHDKGLNTAELSLLLKIPEPEIEVLLSRFEKEKLSIFPFSSGKKRSEEFYFQAASSAPGTNWENNDFKKWTPEALLELYGVDEEKAKRIRTNVLTIFDGLFTYHGLGKEERKLLGIAALFQDIGSSVFPEEKARIGKEILLTHPLEGLKLQELRTLALIIELQSTGIYEKDLATAFKRTGITLSPKDKNKALILASFIRLLDLPGTEALNFLPGRIRQVEGAVEIEIVGQNAGKTQKKAEQNSGLLEYLFGIKLQFKQGTDLE